MISRIVTTAALVAGSILLSMPVRAQTATSAQATTNSGVAMAPTGASASGMSSQSSMGHGSMGAGNSGAQANMQGQMNGQMNHGGRMGGDMNERKMTECLNSASSRRQSLDSCRR